MILNIPSKWMGESSYKLDSGKSMKMKDVLYVPGLKNNILTILSLDKKGLIVYFVDGEVLMWTKWKTIYDVVVIGVEEGGLYKLKGHADSSLMTSSVSPCEVRMFTKGKTIDDAMVIGFEE